LEISLKKLITKVKIENIKNQQKKVLIQGLLPLLHLKLFIFMTIKYIFFDVLNLNENIYKNI